LDTPGRRASLELAVATIGGLVVLALAAWLNLLERFYEFTRQHDAWELDEIAILGLYALVVGIVLVRRRNRDLRRVGRELQETNRRLDARIAEVEALRKLVPRCAWCGDVREPGGQWQSMDRFLEESFGATVSHGMCPKCKATMDDPIPG
jgi:hypothetical protein